MIQRRQNVNAREGEQQHRNHPVNDPRPVDPAFSESIPIASENATISARSQWRLTSTGCYRDGFID